MVRLSEGGVGEALFPYAFLLYGCAATVTAGPLHRGLATAGTAISALLLLIAVVQLVRLRRRGPLLRLDDAGVHVVQDCDTVPWASLTEVLAQSPTAARRFLTADAPAVVLVPHAGATLPHPQKQWWSLTTQRTTATPGPGGAALSFRTSGTTADADRLAGAARRLGGLLPHDQPDAASFSAVGSP